MEIEYSFPQRPSSSLDDIEPSQEQRQQQRRPPKLWTPEEQQKFVEALKIHDTWKQVALNVGTRDEYQVSDYARRFRNRVLNDTSYPERELLLKRLELTTSFKLYS